MTTPLILAPDSSFAQLSERLSEVGWQMVGNAAQPIVPGEPEHAVFQRAGAENLFYSFNPVCRLRVLDRSELASPSDLALSSAVDTATVRAWLSAGDERTVLRGILAAGQLADPGLAAPIEPHRHHPRAAIAQAATRVLDALNKHKDEPGSADNEQRARIQALMAAELLKQQLTPVLQALAHDRDGGIAATLRPRSGDYALAFQPDAVAAAAAAYSHAWSSEAPRVSSVPSGSQLRIDVAPAGMLADDNALSKHFPGGYRGIAHLLDPHRIWVRWKYLPPGESVGMSYDGLVWLGDHWVWFPKPYRLLSP